MVREETTRLPRAPICNAPPRQYPCRGGPDWGITRVRLNNDDLGHVHAPASTAVTALHSELLERMISFSSSTTRKNTRPPAIRLGQT